MTSWTQTRRLVGPATTSWTQQMDQGLHVAVRTTSASASASVCQDIATRSARVRSERKGATRMSRRRMRSMVAAGCRSPHMEGAQRGQIRNPTSPYVTLRHLTSPYVTLRHPTLYTLYLVYCILFLCIIICII